MLKEEKKRVFLIVVLIILIIVYTFELISLGILKKNEGKRLDEDNGSQQTNLKVKENEEIELYMSVKEGYLFTGWTLNGKPIYRDYIATSDATLKATWTDK